MSDEVAEGFDDGTPAFGRRPELPSLQTAVAGVILEGVDEVERGSGAGRYLAQVRHLLVLAEASVLDVPRGFLPGPDQERNQALDVLGGGVVAGALQQIPGVEPQRVVVRGGQTRSGEAGRGI
ncbi:hypothetical protein ACVWWO_005314 [Bradyrhizobium sp. F1.13.1]